MSTSRRQFLARSPPCRTRRVFPAAAWAPKRRVRLDYGVHGRTRKPARVAGILTASILACAAQVHAQTTYTFPAYPLPPGAGAQSVSVTVRGDGPRTFDLTSTARQRDSGPSARHISESGGGLTVRSANPLFDALLAQALDDLRLDSVEEIRDPAYDNGASIRCDCFQTGEKWPYVWTRDLSYSADLSLALLDPARTVNSLAFKVSPFRRGLAPAGLPAGSWQIVQDTGSGGSWPVSTDRVTWALGAEAVLDTLTGDARAHFARLAYRALRGTLEADRAAVFDTDDGLYRGEQSFLDWRDQTYAPYVLEDLTQIAQSKALSTNVAHYRALRLGARLAEEMADGPVSARYSRWAESLKTAINERFWVADQGTYASITTPDARAAPVGRFDMLGEALAVISGVADPSRAREVLAHYPHAPFGVPVYYPEQPDVPVYHNRAIWPFVTSYALLAAAKVQNTAVADNAFDSLYRAAALYLTDTENLEWLTGATLFDDGPVINSPRQLWSVAGYIAMVTEALFGFHVGADGATIEPFLTAHMRDLLGGAEATLSNLRYRGKMFTLVLHLPASASASASASPTTGGYFPVEQVTLNGAPLAGPLHGAQLQAVNVVDVRFGARLAGDGRMRTVAQVSPLAHDDSRVFAPRVPHLSVSLQEHRAVLAVSAHAAATNHDLRYDLWRDGHRIAVAPAAGSWSDPERLDPAIRHCYRAVAVYLNSGNASHPSVAACVGDEATQRIEWRSGHSDFEHLRLRIAKPGRMALSLTYDNHLYDITTGITNAVKQIDVLDRRGSRVAHGIVQMPHIQPMGGAHPTRQSTEMRVHLAAGTYTVRVRDYFNMSYLAANARFGHVGGAAGARNEAAIQALQITRIP